MTPVPGTQTASPLFANNPNKSPPRREITRRAGGAFEDDQERRLIVFFPGVILISFRKGCLRVVRNVLYRGGMGSVALIVSSIWRCTIKREKVEVI